MTVDTPPQQIPLPLSQFQPLEFSNFISADNNAAATVVESIANAENNERLYLWGNQGVGKSHLLQAACKRAADQQMRVAYLPLKLLRQESADCIHGLDAMALLAIDDIELIAGQPEWEEALLHLYNRIKANGASLIISSTENPLSSSVELPDLKSRLSWGLEFRLSEISDEQKIQVLQSDAHQRGFELSDDVGRYLITRVDRNLDHLMQLLKRIDEFSLTEQRRVTIPFIRELIHKKTNHS